MRFLHVLLICVLALAGCATTKSSDCPRGYERVPGSTHPGLYCRPILLPPAKVVPPRSDCPPGYAFVSNSAGTACWPKDRQTPPAGCKPFRCPDSGYMLWDCKPEQPNEATDPELQAQLARTTAEYQCLLRMGPSRVRQVALPGPPGENLSLSLREGPEQRSYYYYRRGQDGVQYICPFKGRKRCEEEGVPQDQECADYSQCLEVCLDAGGRVIW